MTPSAWREIYLRYHFVLVVLLAIAVVASGCSTSIPQGRLRPADLDDVACCEDVVGSEILISTPVVELDDKRLAFAMRYSCISNPTNRSLERYIVIVTESALTIRFVFSREQVASWTDSTVQVGSIAVPAKILPCQSVPENLGGGYYWAVAVDPTGLSPDQVLTFTMDGRPFALRAALLTYLRDRSISP